MKIVLSGANGYIGKNLIHELKNSGHDILFINRELLSDVSCLMEIISGMNVVIHLAGAPILCRWTKAKKDEILKSRIGPTGKIVQAINQLPPEFRPQKFISASAIGIYSPGSYHTEESSSLADGFAADVVRQWENASANLSGSVRKVIFRIAPVIGQDAQIIKQLLPLFKLGLGGRIGSGTQAFPFVHIQDVAQAVLWAIENQHVQGIYNLVAPESITNSEFTKAISEALNRPAFFTVPAFVLRFIYGEAASLLLQSPVVFPGRLLDLGFRFKYPDIKCALSEICIK